MYATHFKLNGRLFAPGIAQDDARFVDERDADQGLPAAVALSAPDSVLVLLGRPGIGKTTFAANALRTATGAMRCAIAWIGTAPASAHELLELLLAEFGFEPYRQSRAERVQTWRQFLMELGATETRVFVGLERAHDLEAPVLSALDTLTTADPNACAGASLVLMGTEDLAKRLEEPSLEPLRQRVRLVKRLHPLDAASVERYLGHAAQRAGSAVDRLFTSDGIAALVRHSDGIPRLVNHIAEGALALAALRGVPLVDGSLVAQVAAERLGAAAERHDAAAVHAPARAVPEVTAADEIPVLTDSIESEPPADAEALDAAATMTLLGDDLDEISAEIAAELLSIDTDAPAKAADEATGDGPAAVSLDAVEQAAGAEGAGGAASDSDKQVADTDGKPRAATG